MKRTALAVVALAVCLSAGADDEITVAANLTITSGAVSQSQKSGDVKLDMTNAVPVYAGGVEQLTSATTQALAATSVNAPGYLWLKNTTATNETIYFGPTNAAGLMVVIGEARQYEVALIPRGSEALYFTAGTTNPASLQWYLITR